MAVASSFLARAERQALIDLCQALFPMLTPEATDDPDLFGLDALALRVPQAFEKMLAQMDAGQQQDFQRFLRLAASPLLTLILLRQARTFAALIPSDQERLLVALATSRIGLLRKGYQALKRLAAFLFYSVLDSNGDNTTWKSLGYHPSSNPPAASAGLILTPIAGPTSLVCDVCVIGSGAGGGVIAGELAGAGRHVIVLEAGSGQQAPDFDQREWTGTQNLYLDHAMTTTADLGVSIFAGAMLGGGTAINWQTSLQTPTAIRDEWASISGCRHFAEEGFSRSLAAVMERIHVNEAESIINPNNEKLKQGCATLGYRWRVLARNAHGCDPAQCGYCVFGCRHGGKRSTAVTYLEDAQRMGNTQIVACCRADRVTIVNGRVAGVEATVSDPPSGRTLPLTIRCATVVVAAGALNSPALLLRTGLRLPALGRHLFLHPTTGIPATYDEPIHAWKGPPQTILCDEFAELSGTYGYRLETAPTHPGLMALSTPWTSGRDHRRLMGQAAHTATFIALVRDQRGGRVRLGKYGRPVIDYQPGPREQAHLRQGIASAVRVHFAAGARDVSTLHSKRLSLRRDVGLSPRIIDEFCEHVMSSSISRNWCMLFSAHQMGTCRMGRGPRDAVCNADGEVFGVQGLFIGDGSAFPASSGVNPMLTIMALAHHTAQRIKARIT